MIPISVSFIYVHYLVSLLDLLVLQDINVFESIKWEAIVIDECQRSKTHSQFEQIKKLSTDMRLLLVSGQLKVRFCPFL